MTVKKAKPNEKKKVTLHPATATSTEKFRNRVLILNAQSEADQAEMEALASWEMQRRLGERFTWNYTLQGWHQKTLWEPGQSVEVIDDLISSATTLLIKSVTYSISEGAGTTVQLELVEFGAYAYKPVTNNKHVAAEHRARDKENKKKEKEKKLAKKLNNGQPITVDDVAFE